MLKKSIHFQHMKKLTPSFHQKLKKIKKVKDLQNNIWIFWEQMQEKSIGKTGIRGRP